MQVLATQCSRMISVPAGGDSGKDLHVVAVRFRVEDEPWAYCLEECEIGIRLIGLFEDVVCLDILLIGVQHLHDGVSHLVTVQLHVAFKGNELSLQGNLFQCQFLNLLTVLRALHLILGGHSRALCLYGNGLRGVDGDVDNLVVDAQAVELRSLCGLVAEAEVTIGIELCRVENLGAGQSDVLKVEHGVLGVGNLTLDVKLILVTCRQS